MENQERQEIISETKEEKKRRRLEDIILPMIKYIGSIGALIMCVVYMIVVFVLIWGFRVQAILETTVFGIVNAVVGFIIMQMLKVQGQDLAADLPENVKIIEEYRNATIKDRTFHNMRYYWIKSVFKDILIKCTLTAATSVGVIYIILKGSRDYTLIAWAVANLLMFIAFGLLSLVKTYKFFNEEYIPYLKEQIRARTVKSEEETVCSNLETKNLETCKNK